MEDSTDQHENECMEYVPFKSISSLRSLFESLDLSHDAQGQARTSDSVRASESLRFTTRAEPYVPSATDQVAPFPLRPDLPKAISRTLAAEWPHSGNGTIFPDPGHADPSRQSQHRGRPTGRVLNPFESCEPSKDLSIQQPYLNGHIDDSCLASPQKQKPPPINRAAKPKIPNVHEIPAVTQDRPKIHTTSDMAITQPNSPALLTSTNPVRLTPVQVRGAYKSSTSSRGDDDLPSKPEDKYSVSRVSNEQILQYGKSLDNQATRLAGWTFTPVSGTAADINSQTPAAKTVARGDLGEYRPVDSQLPGLHEHYKGQPDFVSSWHNDLQIRGQENNKLASSVESLSSCSQDLSLGGLTPSTVGEDVMLDGHTKKGLAPAIPPPRRSTDRRVDVNARGLLAHRVDIRMPTDSRSMEGVGRGILAEYPDASASNRRPPRYRHRPFQIPTEYDTRLVSVLDDIVCTSGYVTKAWNWRTGQQFLNMVHGENVRVTAMAFKPSTTSDGSGPNLWIGTNVGELQEIDIRSQTSIKTRPGTHSRREIIRIVRYASDVWTIDEGGGVNVWKPDHSGVANLNSQFQSFRLPKNPSFTLAHGSKLWAATGREIYVVQPSTGSDKDFSSNQKLLLEAGVGDITCGTSLSGKPDIVYFGHADGKISIYDCTSYKCQAVVNVSAYKIGSLLGVGSFLWAGFNTGMINVYETGCYPWLVKKEWRAHERQICAMVVDPIALWTQDRLQVVTLGTDNLLKFWDGILQEDWLDERMHAHNREFCSFDDITMALLTWNVGAARPVELQHSPIDASFVERYIHSFDPKPDLFVFGFQELVDLEDKKMTAKSFFKSKKRGHAEQEHISHQYRAWRDYIIQALERYTNHEEAYALVHTSSLVGLFTCVFVRQSQHGRIRHLHSAEVKRGMGGLHGNKGALIIRMVIDDSSLCLVNCHLAAGQSQTIQRNNDIAAILDAVCLPSIPNSSPDQVGGPTIFMPGGDGSMILDHETCVLSGDLNYRIDTMGRETVIRHVNANSLGKLLDRDQLLLSRKKNPGFRLRNFQESPITFPPTYKYDLNTDEYDTSEKRRSPAWCDRILFRGHGQTKLRDYRRWEVRISDHRPVSGQIRLRIKSIDDGRRAETQNESQREFDLWKKTISRDVKLAHLINTFGLSPLEAKAALKGAKETRPDPQHRTE